MANVALAFGGLYFSTPANTTLAAATPAKASGTTAAMGTANEFTVSTTNRLTYTGTTARHFLVNAALQAETVSGAETCQFYLYKNGSAITGSMITREVSNNDIGAIAVNALVSLAQNDYVEIWLASTGGDDIRIAGSMIATIAG